jgi:hypothetical protein
MKAKTCRRILAAATTLAAAGALAAPGGAAATTVYPAGAGFELESTSVTIYRDTVCTLSGGAGTVPAAPGNTAAGPVTITLARRPTLSGCTVAGTPGAIAVTTSGTWQLELSRDPLTRVRLVIPAGGFTYRVVPLTTCKAENLAQVIVAGPWANGLTSPLVDSMFGLDGSLNAIWTDDVGACMLPTRGANAGLAFTGTAVTVANTTDPTSPILVGP